MIAVVMGKEYASGTSKKTGKPFAATVVHVAFKKNKVEGQAVDSVWLDPVSYPVESIQIGKTFEIHPTRQKSHHQNHRKGDPDPFDP